MAKQTHRLEEAEVKTQVVKRKVNDSVNGDELSITFTVAEKNGSHRITEVSVTGDNIGAMSLRNVPFTQIIQELRSNLKPVGKVDVSVLADRRWNSCDEQCEAVATLYRHAITLGLPVQLYISETVGKPLSTVSKWVMTARERGYLGKADGSRRGEL